MSTIILYNFSKRHNSTARPDAGSPVSGHLRSGSSLMSPSVDFSGLGDTEPDYNYAQFWGRYYFVSDWSVSGKIWTASLTEDPGATWREYIGSSTQYVLRAAARNNGNIIDSLYPATSQITYSTANTALQFNASDGTYVVGVIGQGAGEGVIYYAMNGITFRTFLNKLLSDIQYMGDIASPDFPPDLVKALTNPAQYIVSAMWYPWESGGPSEEISCGWWKLNITAPTGSGVVVLEDSVTVPLHPQSAAFPYLAKEPYSQYMLYYPQFGSIPLPASGVTSGKVLLLKLVVDERNGAGMLDIMIGGHIITRAKTMFGVPVRIAQVSQDFIGATLSAAGAAGDLFTGDFLGAAAGIGNAINSITPQVSCSGSTGNRADFKIPGKLVGRFIPIVNTDPEHRGAPLCEIARIDTLPGFIQVADADIDFPGNASELEAVKAMMEGGFYYE